MKTWSSWYLTSLRKVYALLQVNRFFRTLAKSSVHNLDASPSLQNYAKQLKKKKKKNTSLGEGVPLDPGNCVTHGDSFSSYKMSFLHAQLCEFSRLGFLGMFPLSFLPVSHRAF